MAIHTLTCKQCGGQMQIDSERTFGFCSHCGTKIIVRDDIVQNVTINQYYGTGKQETSKQPKPQNIPLTPEQIKQRNKTVSGLMFTFAVIMVVVVTALVIVRATDIAHKTRKGTEYNPFMISSAEQLINFADKVNTEENYSLGKYFALSNDIDLGGIVWTPIGFEVRPEGSGTIDTTRSFSGGFDGRGHTISNFTIKMDYSDSDVIMNNVGFFGHIDNATIKNLGIVDFNNEKVDQLPRKNSSSYVYIGGLVGYSSRSDISKCYTDGVIDITSQNNPNEEVVGNSVDAGGLVGYSLLGGTYNSYSSVNITVKINKGDSSWSLNLGGLIGDANAQIENCYATGNIYMYANSTIYYNAYIGGLVGDQFTTITNCFAAGNIYAATNLGSGSSSLNVGGFSGISYNNQNCYRYNNQTFNRVYSNTTYETAYNNAGYTCSLAQLNDSGFYLYTLGWSSAVWNFKNLDFSSGKLPKLK